MKQRGTLAPTRTRPAIVKTDTMASKPDWKPGDEYTGQMCLQDQLYGYQCHRKYWRKIAREIEREYRQCCDTGRVRYLKESAKYTRGLENDQRRVIRRILKKIKEARDE